MDGELLTNDIIFIRNFIFYTLKNHSCSPTFLGPQILKLPIIHGFNWIGFCRSFARLMSRNEVLLKAKILMQQSVSHGAPSPKLAKMLEVLIDHFSM